MPGLLRLGGTEVWEELSIEITERVRFAGVSNSLNMGVRESREWKGAVLGGRKCPRV